jgi:hypothetical protein
MTTTSGWKKIAPVMLVTMFGVAAWDVMLMVKMALL